MGVQPFVEAIINKLSHWNSIIYAGFLAASSFAHPLICIAVTSQIGLALDAVISSFQALSRLTMLVMNLSHYLAYQKLTLAINGFNSLQALTEVSSLTTRMLELAASHIGITSATATSLGLATLGLGVVGSSIYMISSVLRICQAVKHYQQIKQGQLRGYNAYTTLNKQTQQYQEHKAKRDIYHSAVSLGLSMFFVAGSITALLATVTPAGSIALGLGIGITVLGTLGYLSYRIVSYYYERKFDNKQYTDAQKNRSDEQMSETDECEIELATFKDTTQDNRHEHQPKQTAHKDNNAFINTPATETKDNTTSINTPATETKENTTSINTPATETAATLVKDHTPRPSPDHEVQQQQALQSSKKHIETPATSSSHTSTQVNTKAANMYRFFNAQNNESMLPKTSLEQLVETEKHDSSIQIQR